MKSKSQELLDKSINAMISAIEIYNKPVFEYREESFSILAINSWELCLKAKHLLDHGNKLNILYVKERKQKPDGTKYKRETIKLTRSGNPYTHSIEHIAKKLINLKILDYTVWQNIEALIEVRDNSIHFYNQSKILQVRLQEIGMASITNYVKIMKEWFEKDFSEYNFFIMPLAFINGEMDVQGIMLNQEEKRFYSYLQYIDAEHKDDSKYDVALNIDVRFIKSKSDDAIRVAIGKGEGLPEVKISEAQVLESYPWKYADLVKKCQERYIDFKLTKRFHETKKPCLQDKRYCIIRLLDPNNPEGLKKPFFNPNILEVFDNEYTKI